MTFILNHNLAFAALLDLLKLMNFIFSSTVLPATKHMLSKVFAHFDREQSFISSVHSVSHILQVRQKIIRGNTMCVQTATRQKDLQVRSLLENDSFRDSLNIRFSKATSENVLRDIYDGDMYKELSHPSGILHNKNTLRMCSIQMEVP